MDIFILSIYIQDRTKNLIKKTVLFPDLYKLINFVKNKYYTTDFIENGQEYTIECSVYTHKYYIKTIGNETFIIQKINMSELNNETYQEDVKIPLDQLTASAKSPTM
jgi:hypothetical protein